jgi:hypothetical protein
VSEQLTDQLFYDFRLLAEICNASSIKEDFDFLGTLSTLGRMRETDWIKILWWPGYRVFRHQINEAGKTRKLWVTAKTVQSELVRSGARGS